MSIYALVKNNLVSSVIVADESFVASLQNQHDHIVDVSHGERPSVGDSYYKEHSCFIPNHLETILIPVDKTEPHLYAGKREPFAPYSMSNKSGKHDVRLDGDYIQIGCKKYNALGILDALHKMIRENKARHHCMVRKEHGVMHGKFCIDWKDAKTLYKRLKRVRLLDPPIAIPTMWEKILGRGR